jgi:hypothetical protein
MTIIKQFEYNRKNGVNLKNETNKYSHITRCRLLTVRDCCGSEEGVASIARSHTFVRIYTHKGKMESVLNVDIHNASGGIENTKWI